MTDIRCSDAEGRQYRHGVYQPLDESALPEAPESSALPARAAASRSGCTPKYPEETRPPGTTPMEHLITLTWQGAEERYPGGIPEQVRHVLAHEFDVIDELNYAPYFLTVHDIVGFARSRGILCQGRAPPPTRRCATASASPRSIPTRYRFCSSAS